MKKVIWIIVLIVVVMVSWRIYSQIKNSRDSEGRGQGRGTGVIPVELASVEMRNIRDIGSFSGSLKPRSGFNLAPKISGRLSKLFVNIGDRIVNNQLLAVLDDDIYQQQLEQARASLAVAEAQVEQTRLALKAAEANWTATRNLYEKNFSSQAVMDQTDAEKAAAKARYEIALAEVQRARSTLKTAEIQLSYTQIRAEWSGGGSVRYVGERFVNEGNLLAVNSPILSIIDHSIVIAEIDVIEKDYAKIKIGQEIEITTDAYPGRTFIGKLVRQAPILSDISRQARVEIEISNTDGILKPGMFVRVRIIYSEHKDVATVPLNSVVQREGKSGIFVADEASMIVNFVPVTIGFVDEGFVEVQSPKVEGKVVVLGQDQLMDGSKIRLPEPQSPNKANKPDSGARR